MARFVALAALLLTLAACQVLGGGGSDSGGDSAGGNTGGPVRWNRDPNTVVFRAEVVGGEEQSAFFMKNDVPYCTIYGDNRVVWTVSAGGADSKVLWDRLPDGDIWAFANTLAVDKRFYTYTAGAGVQPTGSVSPVVERLTLFVNGVQHTSDGFSGWPSDYFQSVLDLCRRLSKAPVEYEPDAAWISVVQVEYDPRVPSLVWDSAASRLSLKDLANSGQPRWMSGEPVKMLWRLLRSTALDIHFNEGEADYQVAVQVPGITRDAPPPPQ